METQTKQQNSNQSEQLNELLTALAKAQGEICSASKDSNNPFYKSKYADLNSVWNACREPLSKNGLSVIQTINHTETGDIFLVTMLGHASGQWVKSFIPLKVNQGKGNPLHDLGSCITYLRRYALAALVGVAPDDDDGNSGGNVYSDKNHDNKIPPPSNKTPEYKKINKDQLENILSLFEECTTDYREALISRFKKAIPGYKYLQDLSEEIYTKAVEEIKKHLNEENKVQSLSKVV